MNLRRISLVVLATVVIFAAGVITGGFVVRQLPGVRGAAQPQPFLNRFDMVRRALDQVPDLTPEQRNRIQVIIRENQELMGEYFRILQPDTQQVFRGMREGIRAELSGAQRKRFEEALRDGWAAAGNRRFQGGVRPGPRALGPALTPGGNPDPRPSVP